MRKKNIKLWNRLTKELNDFVVQAGWFENSRYDSDTSIGMIARVQNNGAHIKVTEKQRNFLHYLGLHLKDSTAQIVIPPRPFMDNAKARVLGVEGKKIITQELLRVFECKQTMQQAAQRIGIWIQGVIQEELKKINSPPLSPATIAIRNSEYASTSKNKSTKPLNASGLMFETVQYKAEKKQ